MWDAFPPALESWRYDFHDRLVRVEREVTPGGFVEVAGYAYDTFGRRIERTVEGRTVETVWNGLQSIEDYENGSLVGRRVFGDGLDEILTLEVASGPGAPLIPYTPLYDTTGHLRVMLDATGKPVERYDYTPYGERYVWLDETPPSVHQVLLEDGDFVVELTEEVKMDAVHAALNDDFVVFNVTRGANIPFSLTTPIEEGRLARRRWRLSLQPTTAEHLVVSDQLELRIPPGSLEDLSGNTANIVPSVPAVAYQTSGLDVIFDAAAPELLHACISNGALKLTFSERPDAGAASQILLDGVTSTWISGADGYTLEHTGSLASTATLSFGGGAFDLNGNPLNPPATGGALQVDPSGGHIWSAPLPGEREDSSIGNAFGFKGLPVDGETGFLYVRNRYYDPEMGRFIQPDPMGFADGPNVYQFALNNPVDNSDPTGLLTESPLEVASIGLGLVSLEYNSAHGQWGWAALDVAGIAFDTGAMLVPGVPGIAGMGLKGLRAANATKNVSNLALNVHRGQMAMQAMDVGQGLYESARAFERGQRGWGVFYLGMSAFGSSSFLPSAPSSKSGPRFGDEILSDRALRRLDEFLGGHNVEVLVNQDELLKKHGAGAMFGVARRDPNRAYMYLGSSPTRYQVLHELAHFVHWRSLGGGGFSEAHQV